MLRNRDREWLNGSIPEPSDRYFCQFITPIIAGLGEFLGGGLLGAEVLGGGELLGAGALGADAIGAGTASTVLPDLLVTAPAVGAGELGAGAAAEGALGAGAAATGAADLLGGTGAAAEGAIGAGSALGDVLGAPDTLIPGNTGFAGPTPTSAVGPAQAPPLSFASDTGVGGAAPPTPLTTSAPTAPPVSGSMAPVSAGPTSVTPAAPASVGSVSPAQSGDFSSVLGDFSPRADVADFGGGGGAAGAGGSAGGAGAKPEGFLSRLLGTGTVADIKDAGSVISPIAAVGGLGNAILNQNRQIPGRSNLVGLPQLAGQTVASTANRANTAAGSASDRAAAAASDAITRATGAATTIGAAAEGEIGTGRHLMDYINTGELPPGVANAIRSATEASKASIRSQHAARGTTGSSAEAQELNAAADRAEAAGTQVAMQLLSQGANLVTGGISAEGNAGQLALSGGSLGSSTALGAGSLEANTALGTGGMALNAEQLAQQIYSTIMNQSLTQDAQLGDAIGRFSAALAGGGGNSITLKAA